jgi:sulfate adenylyltransferase
MVARPHGGRLVYKVVKDSRRERMLREVEELPRIKIDRNTAVDLENIAHGIYSPLTGFMTREDFESVLDFMRLSNDLPWTMPIVLDVSREDAEFFDEGDLIAIYAGDTPLATMVVEDIYGYDKKEYARKVFKTDDPKHPGVDRVYHKEDLLVGGSIELLNQLPNEYERYTLRPIETRVVFRERGWRTIVGFQTRNAPHIGHEYIQKTSLAFVDGLFINPVIGRKKPGDFRDDVILKAYETLIANYYPRKSVVLSIVRYEMKYAGPREAIHHAIMRKNFGCTHFIVGRDHAGVGSYYGPYEAQEIFNEFPDLGITPLFFREFFYCRRCNGIVHEKICPHGEDARLRFSGTMIRRHIMEGKAPPKEVIRPEVAETILSFDKPFVE